MKPTTIALLQKCKQEKKRFATITAYDHSFAKLFADEGINVLLVGDSLGNDGAGSRLHPAGYRGRYRLSHPRRPPRRAKQPAACRPAVHGLCHPEQTFANAAIVMRAGANMGQTRGRRPAGRHREDAGGARGAGLRPSWPDAAVGERIRWVASAGSRRCGADPV